MSTWIKVDKDGRSYNVAPNANPPSGGGTLQAYKNPDTGDLVFLPSNDSNEVLAPIGTVLSELPCIKGQGNVTLPEQYDFNNPIDLGVGISQFIDYIDPSTGVSTTYGFDITGILYNMTDLTNIVQLASLPELNGYSMFSITPDGIFFRNGSDGPYKLLQFDYSTLNNITPNIPSLELSIQQGIFYVNGKYFVFTNDNNNFAQYLLYSTDLSNWDYLSIGQSRLYTITYDYGEYIIQCSDGASDNYLLKHSAELVLFDQWSDILVPQGFTLTTFDMVSLVEMHPMDIFVALDSYAKRKFLKVNSDFSLSVLFPDFVYPPFSSNLFSLGTKVIFTSFVGYRDGITTFYSYDTITEKLKAFQTIDGAAPYIYFISSKLICFVNDNYPAGAQYTRDSSSDITL